jgi:flagellar biosynthesis/type III secretory pathway protein FliH
MLENTNVREINQAIVVLRELNADEKMRYISDMREKALHDEANALNSAKKSGFNEGMKQGKIKGLEQGKKEGLEQGKKEGLEQGKKEGAIEERKLIVSQLKASGMTDEQIKAILGSI